MTKIISFSLWGDDPKYCRGAIENFKLALDLYPGWISRFYVGESTPFEVVAELSDLADAWNKKQDKFLGTLLQIVPMEEAGDWRSMFWRFNPAFEAGVDVMISRDCDSRLSLREKAAVDVWLERSDKGFHCMRDHPYHTVPILGGMWGVKVGAVPAFGQLMKRWPKEDRLQTDQEFLTQKIWPLVANDTLCHDEFFTHLWGGQPFPTPRRGVEFVGASFDENGQMDTEQIAPLARAIR